ncbi:60S acidic ribosomal protein P1 [Neolecta irregularis DAH-3]|uniref:60S acidic ribosomal protein P1 n=1 Tax=Neolecta irregularis (strain DAH-3) TaxID=1198029 RepID=A0A1U7LWC9_NEOID|nr:60S acidic ribosomal protein P1 [Neolecta irregularis DAH-3]|eukprot:OLL26811.1 60S acidic ribosomal protein P1 [Neolecta irregularis DAH-3]
MSSSELATSYAALILADDDLPINHENLQTLVKAANVEVETIWISLFVKALEGKDVKQLLSSIGSGGAAAPAAGEAAASSAQEPQEKKEAEKKKEEEEESDEDVSLSMLVSLCTDANLAGIRSFRLEYRFLVNFRKRYYFTFFSHGWSENSRSIIHALRNSTTKYLAVKNNIK